MRACETCGPSTFTQLRNDRTRTLYQDKDARELSSLPASGFAAAGESPGIYHAAGALGGAEFYFGAEDVVVVSLDGAEDSAVEDGQGGGGEAGGMAADVGEALG